MAFTKIAKIVSLGWTKLPPELKTGKKKNKKKKNNKKKNNKKQKKKKKKKKKNIKRYIRLGQWLDFKWFSKWFHRNVPRPVAWF